MKTYSPQEAIRYVSGASAQKHRKQTENKLDITEQLTHSDLEAIAESVGVTRSELTDYINSHTLNRKDSLRVWNELDIKPSIGQKKQIAQHYVHTLFEQVVKTYPEDTFVLHDRYREGNTTGHDITQKTVKHGRFWNSNKYTDIAQIEIHGYNNPHIEVYDERFLIACHKTIKRLHKEFDTYLYDASITAHTTVPELK